MQLAHRPGSRFFPITLLAAVVPLASCEGPTSLPSFVQEVQTVAVTGASSCPPQVEVWIQGAMGSCDRPQTPVVRRVDSRFNIDLPVETTAGQCPLMLVPYEATVALPDGLAAGSYTVTAIGDGNEVTATFEVAACP